MDEKISLATTGFELVTKRTRKRVFLDEMSLVVPWTERVSLIQPFVSGGTGPKGARPSFPVETMPNQEGQPEWHFGMKAHIGVDADSGLVQTVIGTAANVNDVTRRSHWRGLACGYASGQTQSTGVRYGGLAKNTAQLVTLFALSNLWMVHRQLMAAQG